MLLMLDKRRGALLSIEVAGSTLHHVKMGYHDLSHSNVVVNVAGESVTLTAENGLLRF